MKETLAVGLKKTARITVDESRTIGFMGDECRVYATPELVRDIEMTSRELLLEHLDAGEDSVGTRVAIDHLAATPLGMTVEINVTITELNGRMVGLEIDCRDDLDPVAKARPGDLVILSGIPNHGKSEWFDAVMVNLAEAYGWRFAVCSFENEPAEHYAKLAEKRLRMRFFDGPSTRMGEGDLTGAMGWLREHFFLIRDERESQTIDWILENARSAILRYGVRCVVVDPWNDVEHHRPDNMSETEYIGETLGKIRRFAQRHGVWFIVVAHPAKLQRDGKTIPAPSLYDISGSAHWHNKADLGIVVYRLFDTSPPQTEIYVRKARRKWVGRIGKATLDYDVPTGRYTDSEERKQRDAFETMHRQGHA